MLHKRFLVTITFYCVGLLLISFPTYAQNQDAHNLRTRGYQLQQQDDLEGAIFLYKEAIDADPSYAAPHNDLGVIYEMKGMYDVSENAYLTALQIDPNYASVYSNLASLYEKMGDNLRALAYWEKRASMGSAQDPWVVRARENIKRIKALAAADVAREEWIIDDEFQDVSRRSYSQNGFASMPTEAVMMNTGSVPGVNNKKLVRKLISQAKGDMHDGRHDLALSRLYEARGIVDPMSNEALILDELIDDARSGNIDYDTARAAVNADLYKKSKMIDVENAWYPPVPEIENIARLEEFKTITKSPARLELEKKARQVIPSINFTEARLKEVIEFLAVSNDINIVIDETVVPKSETVTIHLKSIPLDEALDIILRTKGLKYRFEENIVWITTEEKLLEEDLVVRVYDVQDLVGKLFDFPSIPFDFKANIDIGAE